MALPSHQEIAQLLQDAFYAGLDAVRPQNFMKSVTADIMAKAKGRPVTMIAIGKAAGAMTTGFFNAGGQAVHGLVILPHNVTFEMPDKAPSKMNVIYSAHPVPDENSAKGARAALELAHALETGDVLAVLLSGGGSALMSLGLAGISLADKQAVNQALLDSGLPIQQVNIIRKHLSAIKGGRLAKAAHPAEVLSFALSDVPYDDPSAIASGPTVGDESTSQMALDILQANDISVPDHVRDLLSKPQSESPAPDNIAFAGAEFHIVASARKALESAGAFLEKAGYQTVICDEDYQLDTASLADVMIDKLASLPMGTALISGGEASVAVKGEGVGGRNAQFALEMARRNVPDIYGLSCDTDGIDGARANAGAYFFPGLRDEADLRSIALDTYYAHYDSHNFFEAMGCHIVTGPTETNVNDLRILLKGMPQA